MATAVIEPDTTAVEQETALVVREAEAFEIVNTASYEAAGAFLVRVKNVRKQIDEVYGPHVKEAHRLHKNLVAAKKSHEQPLDNAERIVKGKVGNYQREQERIRREEEDRLRVIARKEAEERQLAEAAELEAQGRAEEAEQVIEHPVVPPAVVVPSSVPKLKGVSTSTKWKHRIVNESLIPRTYQKLVPDVEKLKAHATSYRNSVPVAGVEFYPDDSVSVRSA